MTREWWNTVIIVVVVKICESKKNHKKLYEEQGKEMYLKGSAN